MARQITMDAVAAFMSHGSFRRSNTVVEGDKMFLFGNAIAKWEDNTMWITTRGWESVTTKERLNGLPGVDVYQSKGIWYLNGIEWIDSSQWTAVYGAIPEKGARGVNGKKYGPAAWRIEDRKFYAVFIDADGNKHMTVRFESMCVMNHKEAPGFTLLVGDVEGEKTIVGAMRISRKYPKWAKLAETVFLENAHFALDKDLALLDRVYKESAKYDGFEFRVLGE